jgi:hypothetical protein
MLLQKLKNNVQLAVEQQMIRRVHKKLQRRRRTPHENKDNNPNCFVGNNRLINRFLPKPYTAPSPGYAYAISHDSSRGRSQRPHYETADIQKTIIQYEENEQEKRASISFFGERTISENLQKTYK